MLRFSFSKMKDLLMTFIAISFPNPRARYTLEKPPVPRHFTTSTVPKYPLLLSTRTRHPSSSNRFAPNSRTFLLPSVRKCSTLRFLLLKKSNPSRSYDLRKDNKSATVVSEEYGKASRIVRTGRSRVTSRESSGAEGRLNWSIVKSG